MNNSLEIGSELRSPNNKYIIRSVLGKGGFGITYSATFSTVVGGLPIKAVVAIKEHFLSADCERESSTQSVSYSQPVSERVERSRRDFVGEARRLQAVASGHNNIVQVSEVFDANNTSYYVMEFLEGQSLSEYIKEKGALSEQETMSIMQPIVDAVAYLHENKITHLDIKPGNIMLSHDQNDAMRPVLIDFGLSKHYNEDGSATSTINTQGFSDGFAPIEQYVGITSFSPVSDVYSLAASILYCLTGQRPPKSLELTPAYLQENIPSSVSQNLRDMLFASMQMLAAARPSDASVMLAMLDLHSDDLATSPAIATPTAAKAESKEKISSDSEQTALIGSEETRAISADESTRIVADKAAASKPQSTYTPPPPSTPSQKATLTVDDDEPKSSNGKKFIIVLVVILVVIATIFAFVYNGDSDDAEEIQRDTVVVDDNYMVAETNTEDSENTVTSPIPENEEPKVVEVESNNDTPIIEEVKQTSSTVTQNTENEHPETEAIMDMAMVEQKPWFPGGDAALYKWLGQNIVYPADASEEGVQGRVVVAFVIEKDGSITNVQVVRRKHPALDEEALRVVREMPNWSPGRNNGFPVRVKYHLPISFKLQ